MQKFIYVAAIIAVGVVSADFGLAALPTAMPRKSPEFVISEPSGKTILLSSFIGKVVMIEFFFIKSPKCLDLVKTMNKLNQELGPRGFQPVAIAFPAPGSDANGPLVDYLVQYFKLTYPVGYTNKDSVDSYLGRTETEVLRIPQVVVIDRSGVIRAQNGSKEDPALEDENSLRSLIDGLLDERLAVPKKK